jgi:hypothetical protein
MTLPSTYWPGNRYLCTMSKPHKGVLILLPVGKCMIQDEIHSAGRFVEIARQRSRSARRAGSKPPIYLPNTAEFNSK